MQRTFGLTFLKITTLFLALFFLAGQTYSLIDYQQTIKWGLQESPAEVGDVGVSFLKGYAFADTIFYIPILILSVIGLQYQRKWGYYLMIAALAISVYWPIAVLYSIYEGREFMDLSVEKYTSFSIILPLIILYGIWGLWYLYHHQNKVVINLKK